MDQPGQEPEAERGPADGDTTATGRRSRTGTGSQRTGDGRSRSRSTTRSGNSKPASAGIQGALAAVTRLAEDLDWELNSITGVRRRDEGWVVTVDLVEVHRVPSTTDLIGVYEVGVDGDHEVTDYERRRHYVRGRGDNEHGSRG